MKMKTYASFDKYLADQPPKSRTIIRALRKFVKHARLGERVGTSEKTVLEHADAPRVEAIEAADRADARFETDRGCRCHGEPDL